MKKKTIRVGVGGPVGSGKSTLCIELCRYYAKRYNIAVVTNDIYTQEDAKMLSRAGVIEPERVIGVETGGCPHTAIRDDISMNLEAIEELEEKFPALDFVLIESGGDNLTATFSPELADVFIYVIDVTEGDDIPRKGGPAIVSSDLLIINKVTLAPYVGANVERMKSDCKEKRKNRAFLFTDMKDGIEMESLINWFDKFVIFNDVD